MTEEKLAEQSGLVLSDVGRIERGERDPGIRTVGKIADGLGVSIARPIPSRPTNERASIPL